MKHVEMKALAGVNFGKPAKIVRHADLKRSSPESMFRSDCPVCKVGILLVARNQKTLRLESRDRCILCGQAFIYNDINDLRAKAGAP